MKISVIIPTYGREEPLQESIEDVLQQDYPNFEVLVVDQTLNHQPEIIAYLEKLHQQDKIQWLKLDWASLPGARNYGIRRATGEIILFIDDDIKLPSGYLQAHAKNYQNSAIGAVAGRVFDRMKLADSCKESSPPSKGGQGVQGFEEASKHSLLACEVRQENEKSSTYSIDYLPSEAMDPGIAWYYIDLVHTTKPQQVISVRGCNMSFRREIFTKYNIWFDERFRGSAVREESDFCLRLRKTGYQIWYDPEANLVHLGEETGGCHDISTRSLQYQFTFYHNHFLMALKNLTFAQQLRLYLKLFDCHVLGHPPCNKSGSPLKVLTRGIFFCLGFLDALLTQIKGIWNDGQAYTHLDLKTFQPLKIQPEQSLK